jgi:16S rRNA (cytosine967-C5)-methyltransferase
MASISPARKAAFAILLAIEQGQSHADDLLRTKRVDALLPADRNLTTALVLGTLRWQIELDTRIRPLLKRPNARLDSEILTALRLGAFQLMHLDRVPAHAAIDESVELAKQAGHGFGSGMVNAVLRKVAGASGGRKMDGIGIEPDASKAYPGWMVNRWADFYGIEAARAICFHGQNPPSLAMRIGGFSLEEELAASGVKLEPGDLLTSARTVTSGDVTVTPAFREGRVRLQDEGSQLIAELVPRGSAILDCCAAPGGKTLILAERNPAARIVACEVDVHRLAQMRNRLEPQASRVECRQADATQLSVESAYDVVLADVPCSGTGTLGRNPEIRHRLLPEDLSRQAERQRKILRAALRAVRPGGYVVYSTCSLEPEENEQVVATALDEPGNVRSVSIATRIDELQAEGILTASGAQRLRDCVVPEGILRLIPGVFRTDGFFAAMLQKCG